MRKHPLLILVLLTAAVFQGASTSQAAGGGDIYLPLIANGNASPILAGCPMFPGDNIWNRRVDALPVHARSAGYINSIGYDTALHPDFGTEYGIPYTSVPANQPPVNIVFGEEAGDESDPGPYPIPPNAPVEGGSDAHVLVVQEGTCKLYELYASEKQPNNSWEAYSGAVFDLRSNALRPDGWTSADAAGLPILAGLVRFDEANAGVIRHAFRFTASRTQGTYVWPARHEASSISDLNVPPMGQRFRLKASVNISRYTPEIRAIFQAFKDYGIILADNGSNWYITGAPDLRWDDDTLVDAFRDLHGRDFEAVDVSGLIIDPNSGQSK
jgi:hypothetical protein